MSKPVLGRGLGSLLSPAANKSDAPPAKGGVKMLLKGASSPEIQSSAPSPASGSSLDDHHEPTALSSRPQTAQPRLAASSPLENAALARQNPLLPWFIGADIFFVVLAACTALAGQSAFRWVLVSIFVILAAVVGFLAFYSIPAPLIRPSPDEEKNRAKIRVHFLDEQPKRRR